MWFSCNDVGQLFCRVEQQIVKLIRILRKVQYDDDNSLEKLEELLTDLQRSCIAQHLQQFVSFFVLSTAEFYTTL